MKTHNHFNAPAIAPPLIAEHYRLTADEPANRVIRSPALSKEKRRFRSQPGPGQVPYSRKVGARSSACRSALAPKVGSYRGILPCFLGGFLSRLFCSMASAWIALLL